MCILLAALGAGEARADPVRATVGELFTVSATSGATVRIASGDTLSIELIAVVSDDRCPAETMCAWARPPVVSLRLSSGARRIGIHLDVGPARPGATFEGWTLHGLDLLPRPQRAEHFARVKSLNLYRLVLMVTR